MDPTLGKESKYIIINGYRLSLKVQFLLAAILECDDLQWVAKLLLGRFANEYAMTDLTLASIQKAHVLMVGKFGCRRPKGPWKCLSTQVSCFGGNFCNFVRHECHQRSWLEVSREFLSESSERKLSCAIFWPNIPHWPKSWHYDTLKKITTIQTAF